MLENSSHSPQAEEPHAYFALVREFLREAEQA